MLWIFVCFILKLETRLRKSSDIDPNFWDDFEVKSESNFKNRFCFS